MSSAQPGGGVSESGLASALLARDRRALARAITLVESERDDHRAEARELLGALLPSISPALRIGLTGAPGAGKSTLIEALGLVVADAGRRPAVLAIDPSSAIGGGSILGDKTRMGELARRPEAFIRPSPAGRTQGGVARRTRETILLTEAAGHDPVFVETVGAGQSEHAVAGMVDLLVLVVAPGGGDDLQAMKRGIMELADIVVISKADGDLRAAAERAHRDHSAATALGLSRHPGFPPEVLLCSAVSGDGVADLWSVIKRRAGALSEAGVLERLRHEQRKAAMWDEVRRNLMSVAERSREGESASSLEERVGAGGLLPEVAAEMLLEETRGGG